MTFQIDTPALLFSATSLILLAYTNRFLTIAQIVRSLKISYEEKKNKSIKIEIENLNLRLTLIRYMQLFGVFSLFVSVFAMLMLFFKFKIAGIVFFVLSLVSLLVSLGISFWEISISVDALRMHLKDILEEKDLPENTQ
jgi:glucan phosphoethanolaminetransferase (alkaline phosphatase superfamily)